MLKLLLHCVIWVFHRLPIRSGLTKLSFNRFIDPLIAAAPRLPYAGLRDGQRINVNIADHDGRILYLFGTNDPKVAQTAQALSLPGDVFLDIGANYSTIGLAVSHTVGRTGAVHLFEPQSEIGGYVQEAITAGGYDTVTLHRAGLLDRDDELLLQVPLNHSGMASFDAANSDTSQFRTERCPVHEIGGYAGPLVSGKAFGVKLDIEGCEPAVMPWIVSQPNLRYLIFEASKNQAQLYDIVQQAGLALFGLLRHPLKLRLVRIDALADMEQYHDLLAVRMPPETQAPPIIHPRALAALLRDGVRG